MKELLIMNLPAIILFILACIIVLVRWKDILKKIAKIKYKDLQIDFTDFQQIVENGEGESIEKLRMLLLKQLLFTQEFVNRFQPLVNKFTFVRKKYDESIELNNGEELKYPSLKHTDEALKRFRDLIRNTKFDYVINWDCPLYDKVNSGYRDQFVANLGHLSNGFASSDGKKYYIPDLISDCTIKNPSIDIKDTDVLKGYMETKQSLDQNIKMFKKLISSDNFQTNKLDPKEEEEIIETTNTKIGLLNNILDQIITVENYINAQNDREYLYTNRYNYAMDLGNCMYESLLYWNEKNPRILQSETDSILYIIYQNLSLWLIRNDLPLSQVKLEQYLDTHSENLVARINEEIIKQVPNFKTKMWEQALQSMGVSDININNYFRNNLKDWIIGIQQVRFNSNIFINGEDYTSINKKK